MTLTTSQAAQMLVDDENARWTRAGAYALAEHLESLEDDIGEQIEFDRVALRCDWWEHDSLQEWADDFYGIDRDGNGWKYHLNITDDLSDDEIDDFIRKRIRESGELIEFDGGVIVSNF